jgi:hypothetical protein
MNPNLSIIRRAEDNPVALFVEVELSAERGDWGNLAAALHRLLQLGILVTFRANVRTTITI